jgi:hypothetical protein
VRATDAPALCCRDAKALAEKLAKKKEQQEAAAGKK